MYTYGNWKVIEILEKKRSKTTVLCECLKCGDIYKRSFGNIKTGVSTQCKSCYLKSKKSKIAAGMKFSNYTAVRFSHKSDKGKIYWIFRCKCGKEKNLEIYQITTGKSKQCANCAKKQNASTHGETKTRLYKIWNQMKNRCRNKNNYSYPNYGGRGITVCEEWDDFLKFKEDMGIPKDHETLDRIDNDKGYSKENCRWVSRQKQSNNKRNTPFITYNGCRKSISEWARALDVNYQTLYKSYKNKGDQAVEKYLKKF